MHAVIALAYCDYFLLRDGFVGNCAPTHLGVGVREAGEGVQQPCDTAEGCGFRKDYASRLGC